MDGSLFAFGSQTSELGRTEARRTCEKRRCPHPLNETHLNKLIECSATKWQKWVRKEFVGHG